MEIPKEDTFVRIVGSVEKLLLHMEITPSPQSDITSSIPSIPL